MVGTVITDGETIAALGMAAVHLGKSGENKAVSVKSCLPGGPA
jgi:hypothetical protein